MDVLIAKHAPLRPCAPQPARSAEQGAPEKAASQRGAVRMLQAAADRAVAHDRRVQLEEYAVHKKRATQEARRLAAWQLAQVRVRARARARVRVRVRVRVRARVS